MSNWWIKNSKYDPDNPPDKVKHLSEKQQRKWVHVYNSAADDGDDEETAHKKAWGQVNDSEKKTKDSWWKNSGFNPGDVVTLNKSYRRKRGNPSEIPAGSTGTVVGNAMGGSYLEVEVNGTKIIVPPQDVSPAQNEVFSWWREGVTFAPRPTDEDVIATAVESLTSAAASLSEVMGVEDVTAELQQIISEIQNLKSAPVEAKKSIVMDMPDRGPGLENVLFNIGQAAAKLEALSDTREIVNRLRSLIPRLRGSLENITSSWWKSADPTINDQGFMEFQEGEENWFNDDFRVGDTVMILDTGEQGLIDENYGDSYLVRTENGEDRQVDVSNLQKVDAEPLEDPQYDDLQRFEGGDPEAQDWEDPTFNLSGYIDDDVYELMVGDQIVLLWVDNEADAPLVNEEGEVTDILADGYVVDVQGTTFNVIRDQIELRPVEVNPHYGNDGGFNGDVQASRSYSMKTAAAQKTVRVTPKTLEEAGLSFEDMVERVQWFYDNSSSEDYEGGITWYKSVHDLCQQMAETSVYSFEQLIAIFAVLSPNVEWKLNHTAALVVIEHFQSGDSGEDYKNYPFPRKDGSFGKCPGYPANYEKAYRILGDNDLGAVSGEKVGAFYENFRDGRPLGEGDDQDLGVTIDIWATRIVINRPNVKIALSDPGNNLLQKVYQQVAKQSQLLPKQIQAVTWVSYKRHKGKLPGAPEPVDLPIVAENASVEEEATPVTASWWTSPKESWWKGSGGLWKEFEDEDEENEFMEEWKNKKRDAHSLGIELFNRGYSEEEAENFLGNQLGNGFGMHQFDAAYNGYMEAQKASDPMNQEFHSLEDDPLEKLYRDSWWKGSDGKDLTLQEFDSMWGEEPQQVLNSGMPVHLVQDPNKKGTILTKTPGDKFWVDFEDGSSGQFGEHELELEDPMEQQYRRSSWWR